MTSVELTKAQAKIEEKIIQHAINLGMTNECVEPIPDGVSDAEKYLASSRIMWVMKEPYDDFDSEGNPYGGGWPMSEAFDNEGAWKTRSWQPIIYVSYGIIHRKKWEDLDWISENRSMVDVLKCIAYINISKMPGMPTSNESQIQEAYTKWRSILLEQIKTYEPQIMIFGNTFKYFKEDLVGADAKPIIKKDGVVHIYEKEGIKMFDAYHPNQKIIGRDVYVNSIIESCL